MRLKGKLTLLFLFLGLFPHFAFGLTVKGTLYNNTRWFKSMSPIVLDGDVTVNTGVTLTIDPGVVIRAAKRDALSSGTDRNRVELIVKGTLKAVGTSSSPIQFTSLSTSKGAWYGIIVNSSGKATLSYVNVKYGNMGLTVYGNVDAQYLEVSQSSRYGVYLKGGTLTLQHSKIHHNHTGVYANRGVMKVLHCQLYRNNYYGLYTYPSTSSSSALIEHNTIAYNNSYGVFVNRYRGYGKATIQNNIIVRNGDYEIYNTYSSYQAICRYNLIWDLSSSALHYQNCTNTVKYNPLFVNAAQDDYRIYDRSPARKAGTQSQDLGALPWTIHKTNVLHGKLFTSLTLSAGKYNVVGDLIVAKGVTLTLQAGAQLFFSQKDDMYGGVNTGKAEIVVLGSLDIQGKQGNEVLLTTTTKKVGDWFGIRVEYGGKATIRFAKISYGIRGIYNNGGTTNAEDFEVYECYRSGVVLNNGSIKLLRGKIYKNQYAGFYANKGVSNVSYCQIYRNKYYGIYSQPASSSSSTLIDHNTITHNGSYGIFTNRYRGYGKIIIKNNIITSNQSYEIYNTYSSYKAECSYNLIWDYSSSTLRYQNCYNTIYYKPLFVNAAQDDYHLYDRSPARKADSKGGDLGALAWSYHKTNVLHGKLFKDLTLKAGTHRITGDFIVAKGVNLTIEAGATLEFASSDDIHGGVNSVRAELVVEGNLEITGTPQKKVTFVGQKKTAGSWYGLRIADRGTAKIRHLRISHAVNGIDSSGEVQASDIESAYAHNYGIFVRKGKFDLVRCSTYNNHTGLYLEKGAIKVSYCQSFRNRYYGIYAHSSSSSSSFIWLDHNTVAFNSSYGIFVNRYRHYGKITIQNSIVVRNGNYEIYNTYSSYQATCHHNLIWDKSGSTLYYQRCTNTVVSNPLFRDEAKNDFHLTSTSPARKKANDGSDLGALPFTPTLSQIVIIPSKATVQVDGTVQFKAVGYDSSGSQLNNLSFIWKVVNGGGTISSSGLFTAGKKAGTFNSTVQAASGSITERATVVVKAGPVAKITISPMRIEAGTAKKVTALLKDKYGNTIAGKQIHWSTTGSVGSIDASGLLKAGTKAGKYPHSVIATVDGVKGFGDVEIVASTLKTILVSPSVGRVVPRKTIQFSAKGLDAYRNEISGLNFSWKIVHGGGTIDPTGLVTAGSKKGTFTNTVQATSKGISGYATLIVGTSTPTVARVVISPAKATLKPGAKQVFRASAKDSNGKTVSGQSFTWKVLKGGGTLVVSGGLHTQATFTAGSKPGSFPKTIVAETNGVKGYASIDVSGGKLAKLTIQPASATVNIRKSITFTTKGYDSNGQPVGGYSVQWKVSGGGTIDVHGKFTAGTKTGIFTVTATSGSIKATAKIQVRAGHPPTTPKLRSPKDKSSVKTPTPSLTIFNSTDPDGDKLTYEFEVAKDRAFTKRVAFASIPQATTTSWKVSKTLTEDATYYWRVRASDGFNTSLWSSIWSFTVNAKNAPPTAPKLSSPIDGGQVSTLQPLLEVTNAKDPEGEPLVYQFVVASDKNMQQIVVRSPHVKEGKMGATSWKISLALKDGKNYYWQAWAIDASGLAGPKMSVASFTVSLANKPPSVPKPRSPKDGSTVSSLRPKFEVINAIDPEGQPVFLDIEVDAVQTFDSADKIAQKDIPQSSSGITSWTPQRDLKENTTYFWRVRATDKKTTTVWVFGGEFFVNSKNDPPSAPVLKNPPDKMKLSQLPPKLEVFNAKDPEKDSLTYHFQVSEHQDFASDIIEQKGIAEGKKVTSWKPQGLKDGKTYFWRVRASDQDADGPWSSIWSFSTPQKAIEVVPELISEPTAGDAGPRETTSQENIQNADERGQIGDSPSVDNQPASGGCGCSSSSSSSSSFFTFFFLSFFILFAFRRRHS